MRKIMSILLSLLLSISIISYSPNALFASNNIPEETIEQDDELVEDILEEEIIEDEEIEIQEDEVIEEEVEENDYEFVPGVRDIDININRNRNNSTDNSFKPLFAKATATPLPSSYNLVSEGYVTSVKDQNPYGTCWAHAILASAESTSIMDGEETIDFDLSEVNLVFFEYNNHYADPLNLITDDYSIGESDGDGSKSIFNLGGNLFLAMMNLPSGIGFSDESRLPYSTVLEQSSFKRSVFYNKYIDGNTDWCYENDYYLINVDVFYLDEPETVKRALMSDGAMGISYYHDSDYLNSETYAYYNYEEESTNHAVTLVGWDDNYSKDNFLSGHKPSKDGAWIIKNSWGDDWGNDGYFYLSYEDKAINNDDSLVYQFDIISNEEYDTRIYQYDGSFSVKEYDSGSKTHYEANNYVAIRDEEYIDRIGFYNDGEDVNYTVYVYKDNTSSNSPMSGTLVSQQSGVIKNVGYHSVVLDNPVFLNKGDEFSIVVKFSGDDSNYFFIDETYYGSWFTAYSDYESGQSYLSTNGTSWTEISASNSYGKGNLRVKGYTNTLDLNDENTYVTFDNTNGLTINSQSKGLINSVSKITVDGNVIEAEKSSDNSIVISKQKLVDAGIGSGQSSVVIETSYGFKKTLSVNIEFPIELPAKVYLAFTSDIHNDSNNVPANRLDAWINNVSEKVGYKFVNFASLGDMGEDANSNTSENNYWTYSSVAINKIKNNENVLRSGFFILGNHEWSAGKYATTTSPIKNKYVTNGAVYEDSQGEYVFYSFGASSAGENNTDYYINQDDIDKLETYLKTAPQDKPIFILSHYPLHSYANRTIHGAGETIDVLNRYSYDHTIIYLWGHSHSEMGSTNGEYRYDTIYTDKIPEYDKTNDVSINFTYAAAGCMSDSENPYGSKNVKGKGLVAEVGESSVTLTYYNVENNVQGTPVTVNYKTGDIEPTKYTITFDSQGGTSNLSSKEVIKNSTYGYLPTPQRLGCTFDGWYTDTTYTTKITADSKVTITEDQTLYAHWTGMNVTVTLDANGGYYSAFSDEKTVTVKFGDYYNPSSFTIPTASKLTKSSFAGWYTSENAGSGHRILETTKVTNSSKHTLYAHWGNAITLYVDNSSDNLSYCIQKNDKFEGLPTPSKTGYDFVGWYTSSSGGSKVDENTTYDGTKKYKLYAHFKAKEYTVTFDLNEGDSVSPTSKTVTYNSTYGNLPTPTRTGYDFVGWYTKASEGSKITSTSTVSTADNHTLYAHWTIKKYTITLDSNGGSVSPSTISVEHNGTYGTIPSPSRNGYDFAGWYTSKTGGSKITSTSTITTNAAHTLYAHWEAIEYTISYELNGGQLTNTNPSTYTAEDEITISYSPTKAGYDFVGWYDNESFNGNAITNIAKGSYGNKTLYAKYSIKKYKVTLDVNGGDTLSKDYIDVEYNGQYIGLPTPTKTGYTFDGWYTKLTDGNKITTSTYIINNSEHTLYAHWSPITYTIKFDSNNGTGNMSDQEFTYDVAQNLSTNLFTRTGYTFDGWTLDTNTYVDSQEVKNLTTTNNDSLTLTAKWKANEYTVTFDSDGGSLCDQITVTYDSSYSSLPTPTKTGYTFDGWYLSQTKIVNTDKVLITSDTEFKAKWKAIDYTITYELNGGTNANNPSTYTIESNTITLLDSTKTGYNFVGWYDNDDFNGQAITSIELGSTGNKIFYAKYSPIEYTVVFDSNGGEGSMDNQSFKYDETKALSENKYTKKYYTFDGWGFYSNTYTDSQEVSNLTTTSNDIVTLYASWKLTEYPITYHLDGGTNNTLNPEYYTIESDTVVLASPSKDNYIFEGWYSNDTYTNRIYTFTVDEDNLVNIDLYAKFIEGEAIKATIENNDIAPTSKVYMNGQKAIINEDGSIDTNNLTNPVLTSYETNASATDDIHTKYPTSMKVYIIEKQLDGTSKAVHYEDFDDILTYAGASIRMTGKKGIRIITSIPTEKKNKLIKDGIDGYKVMEYGTIISWASALSPGEEPTLYYDSVSKTYKATKGTFGRSYSREKGMNTYYKIENGLTKYTNTLVEGSSSWNDKCGNDFAMRSYMIIRPKDATDSSKDVILYGGTLYRSISYVAYQNRNVYNPDKPSQKAAYEYIWTLIRNGYGDIYDSEYKGDN